MNNHEGKIEIALDIEINAGIAFWVDKDEWNAMSDDDKRTKVDEAIDRVCFFFNDDVVKIDYEDGLVLSAEVIAPESALVQLDKLRFYDPEE